MALMEFEKSYYIHTSYVDFTDMIKPSSVLDIFQDMAGKHGMNMGIGFQDLIKLNYYWVVLYNEFEVVSRMPHADEDIIARTWVKPRRGLEFEREFEIYDTNRKLLMTGIAVWAVIDATRRLPTRASEIVYEGEYVEETHYPEKVNRKLNLTDECDLVNEYKVGLVDIDHNKHMNNARYLEIVYNMQSLESYKHFKKVRIAFIHEAVVGDTIITKHYKDENNNDCYKGYIGDKVCYEVVMELEK